MRHGFGSRECGLLFVYGTLRRGQNSGEARRLHEEVILLGEGRVRGMLYRVGWYPALVLEPAGGDNWVRGDLLRMAEPANTLAWLDAYEECGPEQPRPHEYRRVMTTVEMRGDALRAWVYCYNPSVEDLEPIPSGDWLCP